MSAHVYFAYCDAWNIWIEIKITVPIVWVLGYHMHMYRWYGEFLWVFDVLDIHGTW